MQVQDVLQEFEAAGAILKGHFILSSGLHSDTYLQCALALQDATRAERLCSALAGKVKEQLDTDIDMIVAPAMGGVVVGYEMGRQLGLPSIFCERVDGSFALRRGFTIEPGAKVLMIEDVVTTGKSSIEAMECVKEAGGEVIAEACLIKRCGSDNPLPVPLIGLAELEVKSFTADDVPAELADIPAVKPGSRFLKA